MHEWYLSQSNCRGPKPVRCSGWHVKPTHKALLMLRKRSKFWSTTQWGISSQMEIPMLGIPINWGKRHLCSDPNMVHMCLWRDTDLSNLIKKAKFGAFILPFRGYNR